MNRLSDFIESGILQSYVMGMCKPEEEREVKKMVIAHPEIRDAIDQISYELEQYALAHAITPPLPLKALIMASVDYLERRSKGEAPAFPPLLHEGSTVNDYRQWLDDPDMSLPADWKDIHAKIISATHEATTAIVWVNGLPPEVHEDEIEKFLIVEGTCDLTVEDDVYSLAAGDYFAIPLHKTHKAIVTSSIPCKFILQRIAV